jgi:hypothetical protein
MMGLTPRTNGRIKCSNDKPRNVETDSSQEELCDCFGCLMDALQLAVDKV